VLGDLPRTLNPAKLSFRNEGFSYVDIRSRANTTRGLDFEHMIKTRAHKGGVEDR
jgi:hypothetical protein